MVINKLSDEIPSADRSAQENRLPSGPTLRLRRPSLGQREPVDFRARVGDLAELQRRPFYVDYGQRVHLGEELVGEFLPGCRIVLLFGIVEARASAAGDEV